MAVVNSKIEWTDSTWSPTTGCTKVSDGCTHCYAETLHERFHGKGSFATLTLHEDRLTLPLRWRKPRRIFVNSMSDLFHKDIPDEYIARVFAVMADASQHTFQLLTKRHSRIRALLNDHRFWTLVAIHITRTAPTLNGHYLPNVWVGVSVEDQHWADIRIPALLDTPAAVRWISAEPLLGALDVTDYLSCQDDRFGHECSGCWLDWVVVGGESGPGARPMHPAWARQLRDQCEAAGVPFLFKQWGAWAPTGAVGVGVHLDATATGYIRQPPRPDPGLCYAGAPYEERNGLRFSPEMRRVGKGKAGRELDGQTHDGYPGVTA